MILISFSSLFVAVILIQLSSGGLGPLDALSAIQSGFSTQNIGMLGSAHFVGFFIGCWWSPRLIGIIGHSRAFAVFASAGTIGILAHMAYVDAYAWAAMRVLSGMCVAGCFTVIEAWLQAKVTNATRGRTVGVYRIVDLVGGMASQMLIAFLEPAAYLSYNILAIFCCASLLPLALTRVTQPVTPRRLRLRPLMAMRISPTATLAVIVAGVTASSYRMVGPVYGSTIGLTNQQLALFLGLFIFGGAVAMYPAGWLSDKFDRRKVIVAFSLAAIVACGFTVVAATLGPTMILVASVVFGMTTSPIYSLAASHANDFIDIDSMVELNSSLLFNFAVGAIASPLLISYAISEFGTTAMFLLIAVAHVLLCLISFIRMRFGPEVEVRKAHIHMPRTTFVFARLLKRRDRSNNAKKSD